MDKLFSILKPKTNFYKGKKERRELNTTFIANFKASREKLVRILETRSSVSPQDREYVLNYAFWVIHELSTQPKLHSKHVMSLISTLNFFLQYGFINPEERARRAAENTLSSPKSSSSSDLSTNYLEEDSATLLAKSKASHYWETFTILFKEYASVRFINFYYPSVETPKQKALSWIMIAVFDQDLLEKTLLEIFSCPPLLENFYDHDKSYLCRRDEKKDLLEIARAL